ncbi:MAG TPA: Zn-dependent hydrolase, partial [Spirochaetota bacterium]|nr:Zn-dependent hydrolase [Spirochaetota bacterium]
WIFTGDLYVGRKQFVAFKDENISDAIDSLKKILQLDFDTVFCSHSGIQKNGKEKIKAKLQFFEDIRGQVVNLRRKGLAPEEIAKIVFPDWNLWAVVSKGEWSALNIINTI